MNETHNISREIVVTLQIEGFHCWPAAPLEVAFLRHMHRHVFHIKCWKKVSHGDRDIEIILFKGELQKRLRESFTTFGSAIGLDTMSCEQLAEKMCVEFDLSACEVLEDGENGAYVQLNAALQ